MKLENLTGMKFGLLTVTGNPEIRLTKGGNSRTFWNCICDCGKPHSVHAAKLKNGRIASCGCHRGKSISEHRRTHGMTGSAIYFVWHNMKTRCTDPAVKAFKDYGARGIAVCEEWKDFAIFYADMGEIPLGATLERKDNSLGYSKDNCRWATRKEQGRNKRNNVLLSIGGVTRCISEWAEAAGLKYETLYRRLKRGCAPEMAIINTI